jgi:hypothetical protein
MQGRVRMIVDADGTQLRYGEPGGALDSSRRITGYFFPGDHLVDPAARCVLMIAPLRLTRDRQTYQLQRPLGIDLCGIEPDVYQVHLVQYFWTDDDNTNLNECRAGIFLGRRRATGEWETPERWPVECRSLTVLGTVDAGCGRYAFSAHGS